VKLVDDRSHGIQDLSLACIGDVPGIINKYRLRTIKKEILKLIDTYVDKSDDLEMVNASMVPPLGVFGAMAPVCVSVKWEKNFGCSSTVSWVTYHH
jgi:hypothetical protein